MVATEKQLYIDDILRAEDHKQKRVDVPEWGGYVLVRTMSGEARNAYEASLFEMDSEGNMNRNIQNIRAKLIAACVVNENGDLMFKGDAQVKALGKKSANALDRIFAECKAINAVTEEDIEELVGKSETDQQ